MKPGLQTLRYKTPSDRIRRFNGYLLLGPHFLHRLIYTMAHGFIPEGYVVHHLDHSKTNNDIDNLIAVPEAVHQAIHSYDWILDRRDIHILLKFSENVPIRDSEVSNGSIK